MADLAADRVKRQLFRLVELADRVTVGQHYAGMLRLFAGGEMQVPVLRVVK